MPDIFVSYAREDHEWVSLFTERLREEGGWDIWWDLKLLPGEQFDDAIESALDRARCVIVVWSQHSIGSRWVRSEAREGARRGVLVPLRIEGVMPPLEFRSSETADMSKWHGDAAHADFVEIVHVVRQAIDRTPARTDADASRRDRGAKQEVAAPVDARPTRGGAVRSGAAARYDNLRSRAIYFWGGGVAAVIIIVAGIGLATRGRPPIDPAVASSSTTAPVAHLGGTPRRLPQLSYGTWTLRHAVDEKGIDWSNSTIKFTSQETTLDGLTLKGTMT